MKDKYIYHELKSSISSSGETSKLTMVVDIETEEVTLMLEKSYSAIYPLKELEKSKRNFDKLNGSGYIVDIERLCKMRSIKP